MAVVTKIPPSLQPRQQRWSSEQIRRLIVQEATRMGINPYLLPAIFSLARLESDFNPEKIGDGGQSYGLFQFHIGYKRDDLRRLREQGLLPDVPVDDDRRLREWLKDPRNNIRAFLSLVRPLQEQLKQLGWLPANEQEMREWARDRNLLYQNLLAPFYSLAIYWNRPAYWEAAKRAMAAGNAEELHRIVLRLGYLPSGKPQRFLNALGEGIALSLQYLPISQSAVQQGGWERWEGRIREFVTQFTPPAIPRLAGRMTTITEETAQAAVGPVAFSAVLRGYPFFRGLSYLFEMRKSSPEFAQFIQKQAPKIRLWTYSGGRWKTEDVSLANLQKQLESNNPEAIKKVVQHILAVASDETGAFAEFLARRGKDADPIYFTIYRSWQRLKATLPENVVSPFDAKDAFAYAAYQLARDLRGKLTQAVKTPPSPAIVRAGKSFVRIMGDFGTSLVTSTIFVVGHVLKPVDIKSEEIDSAFNAVALGVGIRRDDKRTRTIRQILERELSIYKQLLTSRKGALARFGSTTLASIPTMLSDALAMLHSWGIDTSRVIRWLEQTGRAGHMRKNAWELSKDKNFREDNFFNALNMLLAVAPSEVRYNKQTGKVEITPYGWYLYARNFLTSVIDKTLETVYKSKNLGHFYNTLREAILTEGAATLSLAGMAALSLVTQGVGGILGRAGAAAAGKAAQLSAQAARILEESAAVAKGVATAEETASLIGRAAETASVATRMARYTQLMRSAKALQAVATTTRILKPIVERTIPETVIGGPVAAVTNPLLRYAGSKVAAKALTPVAIQRLTEKAQRALGAEGITEEVAQKVAADIVHSQRLAGVLSHTLPAMVTDAFWMLGLTAGPEIDPAERVGMAVGGILFGQALSGAHGFWRFLRGRSPWHTPFAPVEPERVHETFVKLASHFRDLPPHKVAEILKGFYALEEFSVIHSLFGDLERLEETAKNLANAYANILPKEALETALQNLEARMQRVTLQPLEKAKLPQVVRGLVEDLERVFQEHHGDVAQNVGKYLLTSETHQPVLAKLVDIFAQELADPSVTARGRAEKLSQLASYLTGYLKAIVLDDLLQKIYQTAQGYEAPAARKILEDYRKALAARHTKFLEDILNAKDINGIFAAFETFLTDVSSRFNTLTTQIRNMVLEKPAIGDVFVYRWGKKAEEAKLGERIAERYAVTEEDIARLTGKTLDEIRAIFAADDHAGRVEFFARALTKDISPEGLEQIKQAIRSTKRDDLNVTEEAVLRLRGYIPPLAVLTRHHIDEVARGRKPFYVVVGDIPGAYFAATNMAIEARAANKLENVGFHILRNEGNNQAVLLVYNKPAMEQLKAQVADNLAGKNIGQILTELPRIMDNLKMDTTAKEALREFIGQLDTPELRNVAAPIFAPVRKDMSLEDFVENVVLPSFLHPVSDIAPEEILQLLALHGSPTYGEFLVRLMEKHWLKSLAEHLADPTTHKNPEELMPAITKYMRTQLRQFVDELGWNEYGKFVKSRAVSVTDLPSIEEIVAHLQQLSQEAKRLWNEVTDGRMTKEQAQQEWETILSRALIRRGKKGDVKANVWDLVNEITATRHDFAPLDENTGANLDNIVQLLGHYADQISDAWRTAYPGATFEPPFIWKLFVYNRVLKDPYYTRAEPLRLTEALVPVRLRADIESLRYEMFVKLRDYLTYAAREGEPEGLNALFRAMFKAPISVVVPERWAERLTSEERAALGLPYIPQAIEFRIADIVVDENAPGIQVETRGQWSSWGRHFVQLAVTMRPQDWQNFVNRYRQEIGNFLEQTDRYITRAPTYWALGYEPQPYRQLLNSLREKIPPIWFIKQLAQARADDVRLSAFSKLADFFFEPSPTGARILYGPEIISRYLSDPRAMMFPFVSTWRELLSEGQIQEFMTRIDNSSLSEEAKEILRQFIDMPFSVVPFFAYQPEWESRRYAGFFLPDLLPSPGNLILRDSIVDATSTGLHETMHALATLYPYRKEGGHSRETLLHSLFRKNAVSGDTVRQIASLVSEFGPDFDNVAYKPWFFIKDAEQARQVGEMIGEFLVFAAFTPATKLVHMGGYAKALLNDTAFWLLCSLYGALKQAENIGRLDAIGKAFVEGIDRGLKSIEMMGDQSLLTSEYAQRIFEGIGKLQEFFIRREGQPSVLEELVSLADNISQRLDQGDLVASRQLANHSISLIRFLVYQWNRLLEEGGATPEAIGQSWGAIQSQLAQRLQEHTGGNRISADELNHIVGLFNGAPAINEIRRQLLPFLRNLSPVLSSFAQALTSDVRFGGIRPEELDALARDILNLQGRVTELVRTFHDIDVVFPEALTVAQESIGLSLLKEDGTFNNNVLQRLAKLLGGDIEQIANLPDERAKRWIFNILWGNPYARIPFPSINDTISRLLEEKHDMWRAVLKEPLTALISLVTAGERNLLLDADLQRLVYLSAKTIADYFLPLSNYTFKELFGQLYALRESEQVRSNIILYGLANDPDLRTLLEKPSSDDAIQTLLQGITTTPQAFKDFVDTVKWLHDELLSGFAKRVHENLSFPPGRLMPAEIPVRHLRAYVDWEEIVGPTPYFTRENVPTILIGQVPVPVSPEVRQTLQQVNTTLARFFRPLASDITQVFSYAAGSRALMATLTSPRYGLKPDVYPAWFEVAATAINFFERTAKALENIIVTAHNQKAAGRPVSDFLEEALAGLGPDYLLSYAKRQELLRRLTGDALGAVSDQAARKRLVYELMTIVSEDLIGPLAANLTAYMTDRIRGQKALRKGVKMEDISPWIERHVKDIVLSAFTDGVMRALNHPRDVVYILQDLRNFFREFKRFSEGYRFSAIWKSSGIVFEDFQFSPPPELTVGLIGERSAPLLRSLTETTRTFTLPQAPLVDVRRVGLREMHRALAGRFGVSEKTSDVPIRLLRETGLLTGISSLLLHGVWQLEKNLGKYDLAQGVFAIAQKALLDPGVRAADILPFFAALFQLDPDYAMSRYGRYFEADKLKLAELFNDFVSNRDGLRDQFLSDVAVTLTYFSQAVLTEFAERFAGIETIWRTLASNASLLKGFYRQIQKSLRAPSPVSVASSAFLRISMPSDLVVRMESELGRWTAVGIVELFGNIFLNEVNKKLPDVFARVARNFPEISEASPVVYNTVLRHLQFGVGDWMDDILRGRVVETRRFLHSAVKGALDELIDRRILPSTMKVSEFAATLANELLSAMTDDLQAAGREIYETIRLSLDTILDERKVARIKDVQLYAQHPEAFDTFPKDILSEITGGFEGEQVLRELHRIRDFYTEPEGALHAEADRLIRQFTNGEMTEEALADEFVNLVSRLHLDKQGVKYVKTLVDEYVGQYIDSLAKEIVFQTATDVFAPLGEQFLRNYSHFADAQLKEQIAKNILSSRLGLSRRGFARAKMLVSLAALAGLATLPTVLQHFPAIGAFLHETINLFFSSPAVKYVTGAFLSSSLLLSLLNHFKGKWALAAPLSQLPHVAGELIERTKRSGLAARQAIEKAAQQIENLGDKNLANAIRHLLDVYPDDEFSSLLIADDHYYELLASQIEQGMSLYTATGQPSISQAAIARMSKHLIENIFKQSSTEINQLLDALRKSMARTVRQIKLSEALRLLSSWAQSDDPQLRQRYGEVSRRLSNDFFDLALLTFVRKLITRKGKEALLQERNTPLRQIGIYGRNLTPQPYWAKITSGGVSHIIDWDTPISIGGVTKAIGDLTLEEALTDFIKRRMSIGASYDNFVNDIVGAKDFKRKVIDPHIVNIKAHIDDVINATVGAHWGAATKNFETAWQSIRTVYRVLSHPTLLEATFQRPELTIAFAVRLQHALKALEQIGHLPVSEDLKNLLGQCRRLLESVRGEVQKRYPLQWDTAEKLMKRIETAAETAWSLLSAKNPYKAFVYLSTAIRKALAPFIRTRPLRMEVAYGREYGPTLPALFAEIDNALSSAWTKEGKQPFDSLVWEDVKERHQNNPLYKTQYGEKAIALLDHIAREEEKEKQLPPIEMWMTLAQSLRRKADEWFDHAKQRGLTVDDLWTGIQKIFAELHQNEMRKVPHQNFEEIIEQALGHNPTLKEFVKENLDESTKGKLVALSLLTHYLIDYLSLKSGIADILTVGVPEFGLVEKAYLPQRAEVKTPSEILGGLLVGGRLLRNIEPALLQYKAFKMERTGRGFDDREIAIELYGDVIRQLVAETALQPYRGVVSLLKKLLPDELASFLDAEITAIMYPKGLSVLNAYDLVLMEMAGVVEPWYRFFQMFTAAKDFGRIATTSQYLSRALGTLQASTLVFSLPSVIRQFTGLATTLMRLSTDFGSQALFLVPFYLPKALFLLMKEGVPTPLQELALRHNPALQARHFQTERQVRLAAIDALKALTASKEGQALLDVIFNPTAPPETSLAALRQLHSYIEGRGSLAQKFLRLGLALLEWTDQAMVTASYLAAFALKYNELVSKRGLRGMPLTDSEHLMFVKQAAAYAAEVAESTQASPSWSYAPLAFTGAKTMAPGILGGLYNMILGGPILRQFVMFTFAHANTFLRSLGHAAQGLRNIHTADGLETFLKGVLGVTAFILWVNLLNSLYGAITGRHLEEVPYATPPSSDDTSLPFILWETIKTATPAPFHRIVAILANLVSKKTDPTSQLVTMQLPPLLQTAREAYYFLSTGVPSIYEAITQTAALPTSQDPLDRIQLALHIASGMGSDEAVVGKIVDGLASLAVLVSSFNPLWAQYVSAIPWGGIRRAARYLGGRVMGAPVSPTGATLTTPTGEIITGITIGQPMRGSFPTLPLPGTMVGVGPVTKVRLMRASAVEKAKALRSEVANIAPLDAAHAIYEYLRSANTDADINAVGHLIQPAWWPENTRVGQIWRSWLSACHLSLRTNDDHYWLDYIFRNASEFLLLNYLFGPETVFSPIQSRISPDQPITVTLKNPENIAVFFVTGYPHVTPQIARFVANRLSDLVDNNLPSYWQRKKVEFRKAQTLRQAIRQVQKVKAIQQQIKGRIRKVAPIKEE